MRGVRVRVWAGNLGVLKAPHPTHATTLRRSLGEMLFQDALLSPRKGERKEKKEERRKRGGEREEWALGTNEELRVSQLAVGV